MSSHHIVREKQEPALLIMDLHHFNEEYLGQLLEWSPMVMVPLHLFEKVVSLGIKIDAVLANENPDLLYFQEHVKIIPCNDELLNTALKHLVTEGFPAVNIINSHFVAKEYQFYVNLIDIVIFKDNQKIYPIKSGFSKWKAANEEIFILQEDFINQFSVAGLAEISPAHYQTQKDGFFSLTFEEPPFIFIAEQL